MTAVVIGAGIFGSVIAAALRRAGMEVLVVDDARPGAGSPPAACLMKPSWFSALGKDVYQPALAMLDQLYGVHDVDFRVAGKRIAVHWCRPTDILQPSDVTDKVLGWQPRGKKWHITLSGGNMVADLLVVAAGVWAGELLPLPALQGQAGMAFLWPRERIQEPFIRVWAPYRQLVAFNRGDGLWVGDGTSIRDKNWTEAHRLRTRERCRAAVDQSGTPKEIFGLRPYMAGAKPCFLKEMAPGLWVATGGAKNGTLAAGWCAHQIVAAVT